MTKFLLDKWPLGFKEEWDPSGFSLKFNLAEPLRGIVCAIDLTNEVLNKALEMNANLILTHHPFKFEETWKDEEASAPYKSAIYQICKEKRINVLAFHTNYDNQPCGTSYQIIKKLNLDKYKQNYINNYPNLVKFDTTFNDLVAKIKNAFGFNAMRTNFPKGLWNSQISKIAFLSGAGDIREINNIVKMNYDLIVTSDIKWSDWITYKETGTKILEIPHLDEQVFADDVYEILKQKFHDIPVELVHIDEPYWNI
nr:Nif3-like dinuclear metal center hexameric protein [Mycoplasmopsis caviae]